MWTCVCACVYDKSPKNSWFNNLLLFCGFIFTRDVTCMLKCNIKFTICKASRQEAGMTWEEWEWGYSLHYQECRNPAPNLRLQKRHSYCRICGLSTAIEATIMHTSCLLLCSLLPLPPSCSSDQNWSWGRPGVKSSYSVYKFQVVGLRTLNFNGNDGLNTQVSLILQHYRISIRATAVVEYLAEITCLYTATYS